MTIFAIGMMASCTESTNKRVVAKKIYSDTTTSDIIVVNRNFKVGEVVTPITDTNHYRIIRECRR